MLFDSPHADSTNKYLYDAEGQVCAMMNLLVGTMTGYIYEGVPVDRSSSTGRDAEGTRVAKGTISAWTCDIKSNGFQPVSDYIIGPGGEQLTETGSDGQGNMVWSHTNVYAAGSLIGTYDKDGLHFYLSDWLGNRRVQTDYAGVFEQSCTNLPFGDSLNCTASLVSLTEHHFTGKERDVETGNDYFGARYYSSTMGRFLSPDWSAKIMPVPYAKLDNPQSLNLYAYVGNNPLTRFDPDGHYLCSGDKCAELQKNLNAIAADKHATSDVKAAAAAFGKPGDDNGVTVGFSKQPDPNDAKSGGSVKPQGFRQNKDGTFSAVVTVTFATDLKGNELGAEVSHEGSHVESRQAVAASIKTDGSFDHSTNITHTESETRAYGVENNYRSEHGMPLQNTGEILSRPVYTKDADERLYPDLQQ